MLSLINVQSSIGVLPPRPMTPVRSTDGQPRSSPGTLPMDVCHRPFVLSLPNQGFAPFLPGYTRFGTQGMSGLAMSGGDEFGQNLTPQSSVPTPIVRFMGGMPAAGI